VRQAALAGVFPGEVVLGVFPGVVPVGETLCAIVSWKGKMKRNKNIVKKRNISKLFFSMAT